MGHGGNIRKLLALTGANKNELLDYSANINPLGFSDGVGADLVRASEDIIHYPDISNANLLKNASVSYGISEKQIAVGNGSNELLFALFDALAPKRTVLPTPCYSDYITASNRVGVEISWVKLKEEDSFVVDMSDLSQTLLPGDFVILGRPNNPTGISPSADEIYKLAGDNPESFVIVDEAFIDLTINERLDSTRVPNLIILRSLTKSFAIPGLRLGLMMASEEIVEQVNSKLVPWSVNSISQTVGERLFENESFLMESRSFIKSERDYLLSKLSNIGMLKCFDCEANYILIKILDDKHDGLSVREKLYNQSIAIRVCDDYEGLNANFIRIAVKDRASNAKLVNALSDIFCPQANRRTSKKTPSIMFQGTCSDAGKSILTTAFCRILQQDGIKVAPFKAQNMSLNSYVTRDGLEMGRAQVTQAYGAKVDPDVRMNPVLLKPNSETGSQVIINGRSIGNRNTIGYVEYKKVAFEAVKESYDSLASDYDAIVLEGAGSPSEINLKKNDIVNMRMAQYAQAPVLLVGDIDRGGVFASFIGTFCTLTPWEKNLLLGFVVNKFRGDRDLLTPAFEMVSRYTDRDVYGTINYLKGLVIPDEDSVGFKATSSFSKKNADIDVALVDLPHVSNATDIDPLVIESDVSVRIVRRSSEIGEADLLIIPGSKNVISDLNWLKQTGIFDEVKQFVARGGRVVGICGGFQIIGDLIKDPYQIEGNVTSCEGLGLIKATSTLMETKTLKQVSGVGCLSGSVVTGYEIHHGETSVANLELWIQTVDGDALGFTSNKRVFGTYLHGVFDSDSFRREFLNVIRMEKNLPEISVGAVYDIDRSINELADHVRNEFDMNQIYKVMGL